MKRLMKRPVRVTMLVLVMLMSILGAANAAVWSGHGTYGMQGTLHYGTADYGSGNSWRLDAPSSSATSGTLVFNNTSTRTYI